MFGYTSPGNLNRLVVWRTGRWVLILSWLLFAAVGCASPLSLLEPGPTATSISPRAEFTALAFFRAWAHNDLNALYDLLSSPSKAAISRDHLAQTYQQAYQDAVIYGVDAQLRSVLQKANEAQVAFHLTYDSGAVGRFETDSILPLTLENDRWVVNWSPHLIWPDFGEGSRFQVVERRPSRGNIYDRKGLGLAVEGPTVSVGVVPAQLKDAVTVLSSLSALTGLPYQSLRDKIDKAQPDWFVPLKDVPVADYERNAGLLESLPGVVLKQSFTRAYAGAGIAPHAIGYVGKINETELESWKSKGYRGDETVGQTGLERWGEAYLTGRKGGTLTIVDAQGKQVSTVVERESQPSRNIYSTIDRTLQAAAQGALGNRSGAVVALDPRNGQVLAFASTPGFDPNSLIGDVKPSTWQALSSDPRKPLLNRAIQGTYPPGSVFKLVTTAAALEAGGYTAESPFACGGIWYGLGWKWPKTCWLRSGHGRIDLVDGLAGSCDVVFYEIGKHFQEVDKGPKSLTQYAKGFGLGRPTGLEGFDEAAGIIPDENWKALNLHEIWYPGDTVNMAIGQGYILTTPIQMAVLIAAFANGGTLYQPQLALRIDGSGGVPETGYTPKALGRLPVSTEHLQAIQKALLGATSGPRGTAKKAFAGFPLAVAGKTGTAENVAEEPHAWFAGYAPADNPQIAIAVLVEEAGEGSEAAAPIFRRIAEAYFGIEAPTPTPTPPLPITATVTVALTQ
jgi:penicillin-binding protein 2